MPTGVNLIFLFNVLETKLSFDIQICCQYKTKKLWTFNTSIYNFSSFFSTNHLFCSCRQFILFVFYANLTFPMTDRRSRSNLLYNLVGLYEMLDSVWAGCTTRFWLVGLVGENQSSFDFKGAWPNAVQHFWQCVDMLYNITTNISRKSSLIECSPCLKARSFGNSCFIKVLNRCNDKYKWHWTVKKFHWYIQKFTCYLGSEKQRIYR